MIDRLHQLGYTAAYLKQAMRDKLTEHKAYIRRHGGICRKCVNGAGRRPRRPGLTHRLVIHRPDGLARPEELVGEIPADANRGTTSAKDTTAAQLDELERLLSLCEVQAVRSGVPLPLGAHPAGDGVNFAIFSRHATGVRLDLFANPEDAPCQPGASSSMRRGTRPAISGTCGWLGSGPASFTVFASPGLFAPHEGHRFNPDKLVVDPYATAIASLPGSRFSRRLGYDLSSAQQDLSFSELDDAAVGTEMHRHPR